MGSKMDMRVSLLLKATSAVDYPKMSARAFAPAVALQQHQLAPSAAHAGAQPRSLSSPSRRATPLAHPPPSPARCSRTPRQPRRRSRALPQRSSRARPVARALATAAARRADLATPALGHPALAPPARAALPRLRHPPPLARLAALASLRCRSPACPPSSRARRLPCRSSAARAHSPLNCSVRRPARAATRARAPACRRARRPRASHALAAAVGARPARPQRRPAPLSHAPACHGPLAPSPRPARAPASPPDAPRPAQPRPRAPPSCRRARSPHSPAAAGPPRLDAHRPPAPARARRVRPAPAAPSLLELVVEASGSTKRASMAVEKEKKRKEGTCGQMGPFYLYDGRAYCTCKWTEADEEWPESVHLCPLRAQNETNFGPEMG
nr:serine/arginine repetitive matrix protein 1-like [Aegilops tauschii subsp. strangulata]